MAHMGSVVSKRLTTKKVEEGQVCAIIGHTISPSFMSIRVKLEYNK